jgi:hypothetical protein
MRFEVAKRVSGSVLAAALALAGASFADDWDQATDSDNGMGTDNVLFHGSVQLHDLGALPGPLVDQDCYLVTNHPFTSYHFAVDGMTGDLDLVPSDVQRLEASGALLGGGEASDAGGVLSLHWFHFDGPETTTFVRVQGAGCGTSCTTSDRYRARLYDTTYTVPRFNNSGTQATVLLIQNATERICVFRPAYLDSSGGLLHETQASIQIGARELKVVDTSAVVPNQSGSVRIPHTCGYGSLSGKAVSVEPFTGFTFDTPVLHRPR